MLGKEKKVLEELKKEGNALSVEPGEYLEVFKRVGSRKSSIKTLNIKPDFVINELNNGVSYAFIIRSVFDCFKLLNKMLLFKKMGVPLDFKRLYFFFEEHEELYLNEEFGVVKSEERYNTEQLFNIIESLLKDYETRLGKKIILRLIE